MKIQVFFFLVMLHPIEVSVFHSRIKESRIFLDYFKASVSIYQSTRHYSQNVLNRHHHQCDKIRGAELKPLAEF